MGFPPGHFYSPIVDVGDLRNRAEKVWRPRFELVGVDLRVAAQLQTLQDVRLHVADVSYPVSATAQQDTYYYQNGMFPALDAEFLHGALSLFKPKRVIEVGSGFSSLVIANVNRTRFGGGIDFTCVEPYPREFLVAGVKGITRLLSKRLENLEASLFDALDSGDVLFVDSSHVSKTGSDVNFLFFEVMPRLKVGVYVHFHDIFLPDEYPQSWLLDEERSWNEQYLLHAFLMGNRAWQIVWMSHYMLSCYPAEVTEVFPRSLTLGGGGSCWLRRVN